MTINEFQVTGMSCGHCEASVRNEVSQIPGVQNIEVSAATGRLVVTGESLSDDAVIAAVDEAGYEAVRV